MRGFRKKSERWFTAEMDAVVIAAYRRGDRMVAEIAAEIGRSVKAVSKRAARLRAVGELDVKLRPGMRKGTRVAWSAGVSEARAERMRRFNAERHGDVVEAARGAWTDERRAKIADRLRASWRVRRPWLGRYGL